MQQAALDRQRMTEALALAASAIGHTEPNPRVGCVIGHSDGRVLGRGATQAPGQAHAEVMALRDAAALGADVRGATAWVTLEPCAHHGRTPPCCDALVAASLARVVVAVPDPFAQVAGRGIARLRAAGITVEGTEPDLAAAAWQLNIGFFSRAARGRPWVRMKLAASLDGRTALPDGRSQWITSAAARADGHAWRQRASVVLTGVGTVLADNPRLDVRDQAGPWQPVRVVADSQFRTPPEAQLIGLPGGCLVAGVAGDDTRSQRAQALRDAGARTRVLPADGHGRLGLSALLAALAHEDANEVHVEAGAVFSGAMLQAGLVDELLVYQAPRLLGPGRGMAEWAPLPDLASGPRFEWLQAERVGDDLRLRLKRGDDDFWTPPPLPQA
jgi:diaminohydroxyphosphoribosylaminopyrimidine deaminase/5-amino-6-(5-phosphoribosylamino)uracil reductase